MAFVPTLVVEIWGADCPILETCSSNMKPSHLFAYPSSVSPPLLKCKVVPLPFQWHVAEQCLCENVPFHLEEVGGGGGRRVL